MLDGRSFKNKNGGQVLLSPVLLPCHSTSRRQAWSLQKNTFICPFLRFLELGTDSRSELQEILSLGRKDIE